VEIVDYLRIARRRIWVLVGIPLVAALAASVLVILSPHEYTARATVAAPALVGGSPGNQYTGSQAVNQFVSAFQSTATGPQVRQAVSAQLGVSSGSITSGLSVTQIGASSNMALAYTSSKRKDIVPVLTAITKETLTELFQSQVDLANQQIADARSDISKANAAILAWEQKNKVINPPQAYQAAVDRLSSLQQQQALQIANGKPSGSAALASQIASVETTISKFGPLLADFDVLAAARDAATASLTSAQQNLLGARAQLLAADPAKVAYIGGEHEVGEGSAILSKVLPITGAAVFAAVALIVILELLSGARTASSRREVEAERQREITGRTEPVEPVEPIPPAPLPVTGSTDEAEPATDDRADDGEPTDDELERDVEPGDELDDDEYDDDVEEPELPRQADGRAIESDEVEAADEIDHEVDDFDDEPLDDSEGEGERPYAAVVR
jgi:capsular polysaccharide biosynthesis protein